MENKKVQELADKPLENVIGGVSARGYYNHQCNECKKTWRDFSNSSACPECNSTNITSWPT